MNESSKANDHGTPDSEGPDIVEPELDAATISEDVAETVDLKAAEAEAAAVEHEAELAARGVSPEVGKSDAGAAAPPAFGSPDTSGDGDAPAGVPQEDASAAELPAAEPATPGSATHDAATAEVQDMPGEPVDSAPPAPEKPLDAAPSTPESPVEPGTPAIVPPQKPGHVGPGIDDGHGWRRSEARWEQSSTPWQPKAGAWQSPAQMSRNAAEAAAASEAQIPAGTSGAPAGAPGSGTPSSATPASTPAPGATTPAQPPVPPAPGTPGVADSGSGSDGGAGSGSGSDGNPKKILIIAGIVLVALALLVLLIMLLVGLFTGDKSKSNALPAGSGSAQSTQSLASTAKSSGDTGSDLIVAGVSPLDWMAGDCLRDFRGTSEPADVVLCNSPHNAQLVGTFYYGENDAFPGAASLKVKAAAVCKGVVFTSEASGLTTLKQSTAYPSESTWNDKDDRRVDCMVHDTRSGNPLKVSLTQ